MILDSTLDEKKGMPTRYLILLIIFVVTAVLPAAYWAGDIKRMELQK